MNRLVILLFIIALIGPAQASTALRPALGQDDGGDYIISLRRDVGRPAAVAAEIAQREGLEITNVFDTVGRGFAARVPAGRVRALAQDDRVVSIERDLPTRAFADDLPTGVNRIGADTTGEGQLPTRAGQPVAILDTGIARHPDLNVVGGYNCTAKQRKQRQQWTDKHGHGTHVAGIVGARNDGVGTVGVAPGTPLYAVKVLGDNGGGKLSWATCGLNWAVKNGIKVVNLSLGADAPRDDPHDCGSSNLHQAVCDAVAAGVVVVVAAGNGSGDADTQVPAKYRQAITVSALADSDGCAGGHGPDTAVGGPDDTFARFSNFGPAIDVAAPGASILSTFFDGTYKKMSGTSMAAPHVAAAYALGWDGTKDPASIPGDPDGTDEGLLWLSANTGCAPDPGPVSAGAGHDGRQGNGTGQEKKDDRPRHGHDDRAGDRREPDRRRGR